MNTTDLFKYFADNSNKKYEGYHGCISAICDPNQSLEKLASFGSRDQLIVGISPCFGRSDGDKSKYGEDLKYLYGINVRTPNNLKIVLPFFKMSDPDSELRLDHAIKTNQIRRYVPEFAVRFRIRELTLIADRKNGVILADSIKILSCTTEDDKPLSDDDKEQLADFLADKTGFFAIWATSLEMEGTIYLWITSEDFNVADEGRSLSNIIAVTNNYDALMRNIIPQRPSFLNFLFLIKARYLYDLEKKQRDSAINAAKAAIMSRNMSHNLGSHVMYYIKQKLHSVQKILDEGVLSNLSEFDLSNVSSIAELIAILDKLQESGSNKDLEMPFLVGLGRFINYLQERQDYIATVATDYIPANSTISFKDFIYDELKPDLRYDRHKKAGSSSSETRRQQPKNLLMDYIAYSEKYEGSDSIRIRFGAFDGTNPKFAFENGVELKGVYDESSPEYKSFRNLRDFNVALPGGVIGRQALFSIMENVIRNAAKHSERRSDGLLAIDFDILGYDDEDLFSGLRCIDVTSGNNQELAVDVLERRYKASANKYFMLGITNNMPNTPDSVDKLVRGLAIPYIKEDSTMEDSGKGLKEIRISASWMRGYQHDLNIPPSEPPAVSIRALPYYDEAEGKTVEDRLMIQYVICLPKPRFVVIVVPPEMYDKECNEVLKKIGCELVIDEDSASRPLYDYDLVIFCSKNVDLDRLIPFLSARYVSYDDEVVTHLEKLIDAIRCNEDIAVLSDYINDFYRLWYTHSSCTSSYETRLPALTILDDKALIAKMDDEKIKKMVNSSPLVLTSTSDSAIEYQDSVVYSTHYQSMCHVDAVEIREKLKNAAFIEGITGNNSTDRLIRQTKWDNEWLYKHLMAGLSKVAIFDERIFDTVNPKLVGVDYDFAKEYLWTEIGNADSLKLRFKDIKDAARKVYPGCRMDSFQNKYFRKPDGKYRISIQLDRYMIPEMAEWFKLNNRDTKISRKYHETNIWAFDVRRAFDDNSVIEVLGYNTNYGDTIGEYRSEETVEVVMKIKSIRKGRDIKIEFTFCNETLRNKFHLLTIHQGILDKIYEAFKVKDDPRNKEIVTKALYEALVADPHIVKLPPVRYKDEEYDSYFLPRFVIHSGRSKPGYNDMPQKLPFVQFAAIDHAVRDCKYTLSELLYSAHYEKNNSDN